MAPKVIWIASYPKSGNTWVRFLLCNLLYGRVDSAADLDRLAPDIHDLRVDLPEWGPLLLKTHFPLTETLPLRQYTAGAIYVVRDPADVMMSGYHYSRGREGALKQDAAAFDRYLDRFMESGGDPNWQALGMGTWSGHVRSWLAEPRPFPVVQVRYEDLLEDPEAVAARLCQPFRISRSREEIARAVAGSSFERLRQIEESDIAARRQGIFYKPYLESRIGTGARFMRAGVHGQAAGMMSPGQRQRFQAVFGAAREALGYAGGSEPPVPVARAETQPSATGGV